MTRRSDRLAREARERLSVVASQLGAAGGAGDGWVPARRTAAPVPPPEPAPEPDPEPAPEPDPDPAPERERAGAHRARRALAAGRIAPGGGPRRLALTRTATAGLAVVALLAAALAAGLMWRARPVPVRAVPARQPARATPLAITTVSSSRAVPSAGPPPAPAMAATTASTPAGGSVLVDVVGQVHRPGLVHLPSGARVDDAVRAAGGATARADLSAVNLARVVVDGEQVRVPAPGEAVPPPPGAAAGQAGAGAGGSPGAPLDLNAATVTDLDALPGVGPVLAQRILDWRTQHTRFTSVDELREVRGIGDKVFADLRPLVRV